ncbi:MAG: Ig-like domain-containing protein [Armatimonadetes bacterium]|nr:Ig-like domain-containing protein [Armatimonadota bacterium]
MVFRIRMALLGALLVALAGAAIPARADELAVRLEPADGATLTDVVKVAAKVTGADDDGVEKVEFFVDGQARSTDTSTPYELEWDTLKDPEGAHTVVAKATDAKGRTAEAKATYTLDNQLANGAEFHADAALEAIKGGSIEAARKAARRALQIDPGNLKAARAMAGILRSQREYGKAIEVLLAASMPPTETAARQELVALRMLTASDTLDEFLAAASQAAVEQQRLNEARVAAATTPEAKGDAYYMARNWNQAVRAYQEAGSADEAPIAAANRLLLTYIRSRRMKEADGVLRTLKQTQRGDATTRALEGLYLLANHQVAKARETVQTGLEGGGYLATLVAIYAEMAMGHKPKASEMLAKINEADAGRPEVAMIRAYLVTDVFDLKTALLACNTLDPSAPEPYVIRAYQMFLSKEPKPYEKGDALLEMARKMDPEDRMAKMASAVSFLVQKRHQEAEPFLAKLRELEPGAPDAMVAQALLFSYQDKTSLITDLLNKAMKIDDMRWNDVYVPTAADLLTRVYRYRFQPIITPGAL